MDPPPLIYIWVPRVFSPYCNQSSAKIHALDFAVGACSLLGYTPIAPLRNSILTTLATQITIPFQLITSIIEFFYQHAGFTYLSRLPFSKHLNDTSLLCSILSYFFGTTNATRSWQPTIAPVLPDTDRQMRYWSFWGSYGLLFLRLLRNHPGRRHFSGANHTVYFNLIQTHLRIALENPNKKETCS